MGSGQFEGEDRPPDDPRHSTAIAAWNMLCNGMGGMDWAGFPIVCALLGIDDVQALVDDLLTIKTFRPEAENGAAENDGTRMKDNPHGTGNTLY